MGWERSGRAPQSVLVTNGKCFISAQLDSAPNPVSGLGVGGHGSATAAPWGQGKLRAGSYSQGVAATSP